MAHSIYEFYSLVYITVPNSGDVQIKLDICSRAAD